LFLKYQSLFRCVWRCGVVGLRGVWVLGVDVRGRVDLGWKGEGLKVRVEGVGGAGRAADARLLDVLPQPLSFGVAFHHHHFFLCHTHM